MDAKVFSLIKKDKKSNTISFKSVPLNIKIGGFLVKKEHTFFGFLLISDFHNQNVATKNHLAIIISE